MCAARDVGAKMAQSAILIIIPANAHMAKPCDAGANIVAACRHTFIPNRELAS